MRRQVSESRALNRCTVSRIGFTLIELLVVVSVIALLISILLPSLKRAREQGKRAVCLANLKSLGTASQLYASGDSSEFPIPVPPTFGKVPFRQLYIGAYDWGGKAGQGEPASNSDLFDSIWGTALGRGPGARPLNSMIYKSGFEDFQDTPGENQVNWRSDQELDLPMYRCPSDRGYMGFHFGAWKRSGLSSYDHYGNSYSHHPVLSSPGWLSPPIGKKSSSAYFRRLSTFLSPGRTLLYTENCGRFAFGIDMHGAGSPASGSPFGPGSYVPDAPRSVGGWHGEPYRFVSAFVDGHAGVIHMEGMEIPQPVLSSYPPDPDPTEDVREFWRPFIMRGPDWQIDTLPSFPVATPLTWETSPFVPWMIQ